MPTLAEKDNIPHRLLPAELYREKILSSELYRTLLDPISQEVMTDPVTTCDGYTFERTRILAWFERCRADGLPLTSPVTQKELENDNLVANQVLKKLADTARQELAESAMVLAETKRILRAFQEENPDGVRMLTSEIFADMDRLMNLNLMKTLSLKPPQIIVVGNQNSGKSSVLERLIGFSLFPRDYELCTRCLIRVKLRRENANSSSIASIAQLDRATGEIIESTKKGVSLEIIGKEVKDMMDRIMCEPEEQGNAISTRKEIIIEISASYCPNLNVLDVPGQVQSFHKEGVTQDVSQVAIDLAESVIKKEKDYSIFLLVHDARSQIDQSRAARLVKDNQLQERTVGVLTRLDIFIPERPDRNEVLNKLKMHDPKTDPYTKYGWLACANIPMAEEDKRDIDRLLLMDVEEMKLLAESRWKVYAETKRAGMKVIRETAQILFEDFLVKEWVPELRKHLANLFIDESDKNFHLGLPMPNDIDYDIYLTDLREIIPTAFPKNIEGEEPIYPIYDVENGLAVQDEKGFKEILEKRMKEVCHNLNWAKLPAYTQLWDKLNEYKTFIDNKNNQWKAENGFIEIENAENEMVSNRDQIKTLLQEIIKLLVEFQSTITTNLYQAITAPEKAMNQEVNTKLFQKLWNFSFGYLFKQTQQEPDTLAILSKFDRFHQVMPEFKSFLQLSLQEMIQNNFQKPSEEKLKNWELDDLKYAICDYVNVNDSIKCRLSWSMNIYNYPSIFLNLFFEKVLKILPTKVNKWNLPPGKLNEYCKEERKQILKAMLDIIMVLNALRKLEDKVHAVRKVDEENVQK
jgi:GTPase SAR1 family protein